MDQGQGIRITYYVKGVPTPEINEERKKLLKGLFNHAQAWVARIGGESSDGVGSASDSLEISRSKERFPNYGMPRKFTLPEKELILKQYRKEYSRLSDLDKAVIEETEKKIQSSNSFDYIGNTEDSLKTQSIIFQISLDLFGPFPNSQIYSIGTGPAWFAAVAQIHQPNPDRIVPVAFSKGWYELANPQIENPSDPFYNSLPMSGSNIEFRNKIDRNSKLQCIEQNMPTPEQAGNYNSLYLKELGCGVEDIIKRPGFTVFVFYMERAGSAKSFLEFLNLRADEKNIPRQKLKEKVVIQCIYDQGSNELGYEENVRGYLLANIGEYTMFPILTIPVTNDLSPQSSMIREMFSSVETPFTRDRRLVKDFPPTEWSAENCQKSTFCDNKYIFPIYAALIRGTNIIKNNLEASKMVVDSAPRNLTGSYVMTTCEIGGPSIGGDYTPPPGSIGDFYSPLNNAGNFMN
jgi:hypothetical protein